MQNEFRDGATFGIIGMLALVVMGYLVIRPMLPEFRDLMIDIRDHDSQ